MGVHYEIVSYFSDLDLPQWLRLNYSTTYKVPTVYIVLSSVVHIIMTLHTKIPILIDEGNLLHHFLLILTFLWPWLNLPVYLSYSKYFLQSIFLCKYLTQKNIYICFKKNSVIIIHYKLKHMNRFKIHI